MPLENTTPRRSPSTTWPPSTPACSSGFLPLRDGGGANPASVHASRAAISAIAWLRSRRRSVCLGMTSDGSTFSVAENLTGRSSMPSQSSFRTPDSPASRADQVDGRSPPSGVVAPRPVTTTLVWLLLMAAAPCGPWGWGPVRRRPFDAGAAARRPRGSALLQVLHEVDDVLDRLQVAQLVVGDLDAELVLGGHGDLDHRQGVDVEVVDEVLVGGHLGLVDPDDVVDDLGEAVEDLLFGGDCHGSAFSFGGLGPEPAGRRDGLRDLDDLGSVGQSGAESDQQGRCAGRHVAAFDHSGQ